MATRNFTTFIPVDHTGANVAGVIGVMWSGLLNTDVGKPYVCGNRIVKSVQAYGTFGVSGSVQLQGSNDQAYTPDAAALAPVWVPLSDRQANQLDITVAKMENVQENPNAVRPSVTAGDGTTTLTVVMILSGMGGKL